MLPAPDRPLAEITIAAALEGILLDLLDRGIEPMPLRVIAAAVDRGFSDCQVAAIAGEFERQQLAEGPQ